MTRARHEAYKKVVATLDRLGPAKLQESEEENLRDLAEGLLLTQSADDAEAMIGRAEEQMTALVSSGRWMEEVSEPLLENIRSCWHETVRTES